MSFDLSLLQNFPYQTLILSVFSGYAVVIAIFLILENRSPQSTFAWMFLFIIFPIGGLVLYLFFGRGYRAFSKESELMQQALGTDVSEYTIPYLAREAETLVHMMRTESPSYKRKILELVRRNSNSVLTSSNHLEILQNASQKYPRLLEDIRQAKHFIHMAYYIWDEDEFTNQVKALLIEKAQAGVEVRVLCDAQGLSVSRRYLREMRAGGVEMYVYFNYLSPFKFHTISYRNHRKIAVIDGRIGYMGGLNMSQEHLDGGKHFSFWRDTHLRFVGEATAVLQASFITSWYNTTQERLSAEKYFPPIGDEIDTFLPIQITTSGPDSQWAAIRQLYFLMILSAEKHIYIQSPFFIPDTSISEALKAAALSGVDVKMMFAPRGTRYSVPYWAANTYFAEMARAGIRIFLYQKGYFHPKTISIDSAICSVGTANMDVRSFVINYEINAIIYAEEIASRLERDFHHDLEECVEFTLEEYESRSTLLRLRDSVCRLFSPLL